MPSAKAQISLGSIEEVAAPCNEPLLLPERKLSQVEIERHWAKDRASLIICRDEKGTLVSYFKSLQSGFSSPGK